MPGTALGPSLTAPAVRYSLDLTCCDGWGSGNGLTPTAEARVKDRKVSVALVTTSDY